jgi:hypothetical protein
MKKSSTRDTVSTDASVQTCISRTSFLEISSCSTRTCAIHGSLLRLFRTDVIVDGVRCDVMLGFDEVEASAEAAVLACAYGATLR